MPQLHVATTALAALALIVVIVAPRLPVLQASPGAADRAGRRDAGPGDAFTFRGVATIGTAFGGIPAGLPSLHVPEVTAARVIELIGPAFTIAMLGAIESLLSAVVADGMAGTRHDSNQELVGQGIANIVAPLFGGFAATGAIARTATNMRNGGTSPLAGIVHAVTLVLIILFLAPLAVHVPLAALAAILFVVAWNMSEARHFVTNDSPCAGGGRGHPARDLRADGVRRSGRRGQHRRDPRHAAFSAPHGEQRRSAGADRAAAARGVRPSRPDASRRACWSIAVEGPFFFGAVENFERALASTHTDPEVVILRLRWVPFIDITGLQTLEEVVRDLHRRKVRVMLTGANERVTGKLEKAGLLELLGRENFCRDLPQALTVLGQQAR